jgi:hypothetical protein
VREEELKEGEDYYLEDGYLVFTKAYHLKRGLQTAALFAIIHISR